MKKVLLGLFIAVFVSVGITSASVSAAPPETTVTGVVTENHIAVSGATVTVVCNGHTETDTTDVYGTYLVHFVSADCPFGSTVKVTGQKDDNSGVASGTVRGVTTKLNLAIVNVEIPEYGLIGALTAGGIGIGLVAYTRRKQGIAAA
jgi:hypothetical protein